MCVNGGGGGGGGGGVGLKIALQLTAPGQFLYRTTLVPRPTSLSFQSHGNVAEKMDGPGNKSCIRLLPTVVTLWVDSYMHVLESVQYSLPDSAQEPEGQEPGVVGGEGGGQAERPVEGEGGDEAGATPGNVRPAPPEVPAHHHPEEDDGIKGSLLHRRGIEVVVVLPVQFRGYEGDALDLD